MEEVKKKKMIVMIMIVDKLNSKAEIEPEINLARFLVRSTPGLDAILPRSFVTPLFYGIEDGFTTRSVYSIHSTMDGDETVEANNVGNNISSLEKDSGDAASSSLVGLGIPGPDYHQEQSTIASKSSPHLDSGILEEEENDDDDNDPYRLYTVDDGGFLFFNYEDSTTTTTVVIVIIFTKCRYNLRSSKFYPTTTYYNQF